MDIKEFSKITRKDLDKVYDVEGKEVILTSKERENKEGAQTYWTGTIDGTTFERLNMNELKKAINNGVQVEGTHKKRNTTLEPKNGIRVNNEFEQAGKILKQYKDALQLVTSLTSTYNIHADADDAFNVCGIASYIKEETDRKVKELARRKEFERLHAARLQMRRERLKAYQDKVSADMIAGIFPTKAVQKHMQALDKEVTDFANRTYIWQKD